MTVITEENGVRDCSLADDLLIEGIEAECLLADKAYDTNEMHSHRSGIGNEPQ